jgi:hypothetical protein
MCWLIAARPSGVIAIVPNPPYSSVTQQPRIVGSCTLPTYVHAPPGGLYAYDMPRRG